MFSKKATKIDKIFTVNLIVTTYCQIVVGEDFVNFCGLLRKHELWKCMSEIHPKMSLLEVFKAFNIRTKVELGQKSY